MAENRNERMEIMWGYEVLDSGFTSYPNRLIRTLKKVGLTPNEALLVLNILTHKHDTRDPYPSYETLADYMDCTTDQIKKLIQSIKKKKLVIVGRRKDGEKKTYMTNAYNFKPLIDACLQYDLSTKTMEKNVDIVWSNEEQDQEKPGGENVPMGENLPMDQGENVPMDGGENLPLKKKRENENIKMVGHTGDESQDETPWQEFQDFCKQQDVDLSLATELWKVYQYNYPECPLYTMIHTIHEMIRDQTNWNGGEVPITNFIGLFHHRMKRWKEMEEPLLDAYKDFKW